MSEHADVGVARRLEHLREFFTRDIWEVRLEQLPARRARGYRALRLVACAVHGLFFSARLSLHAAALTYYTVLSLVPLLAFAFALLKGFGAYDTLIEHMVRPYALETFGASPALRRAIEQVLNFVGRTSVASLGFAGLLTLLYAATSLLRNIEVALNYIWEAEAPRGPVQQLTHYVAIIVVTPTCLLVAAAAGTLAQSIAAPRWLESKLGIGAALEWAVARLGPLVIVFVGLVFLYTVMPNTRVRTRSAVVGAVIGSLLWYGALILHVRFQVGVASFNALYSGFAALPIFLVWLDVSWQVVLVGAEVAATHQHERARAQHKRAAKVSQALREALCLSAMLRIARSALGAEPPPTTSALSAALDAPESRLGDGLRRLAAAGLVVQAGAEADPQWVLERVPEQIHVKDVLDALRDGTGTALREWPGLHPSAVKVLVELERALERADANRSLRELLADRSEG